MPDDKPNPLAFTDELAARVARESIASGATVEETAERVRAALAPHYEAMFKALSESLKDDPSLPVLTAKVPPGFGRR